jgi:hypothetical protein
MDVVSHHLAKNRMPGSIIRNRSEMQSRYMRPALGLLVVVLAHVGFATLLLSNPISVHRIHPTIEPMIAELLGAEIGTAPSPQSFSTTDPRVELAVPDLPMDLLPEPNIEAPRIDADKRIDTAPFTARAHLTNGTVAIVILALQIAADGSVISAEVVRGNGDDTTNAVAIEYAHATRWIPGAIDGQPHAMQASLTVILGESA